jgi:hypothetical protein
MTMMSDDEGDEGADEGEKPRGDASEKQLNFIRSLQKRITLEDDELEAIVRDVAGVDTLDDLDRKQASEVIDELQTVAREKGIDLDSQPVASEKQVGFMKSLKRRAHLTDDEFAALLQDKAGVTTPEEVGKRDASAIIDELLALANDPKAKKPDAGGAKKKAPAKKADDKPPAKKKVLEGSRPATGAPKKAAAAPAKKQADEDDDGAPVGKPPADVDDDYEPGADVDDADLDKDPGDSGDDDLPF